MSWRCRGHDHMVARAAGPSAGAKDHLAGLSPAKTTWRGSSHVASDARSLAALALRCAALVWGERGRGSRRPGDQGQRPGHGLQWLPLGADS